MTLQDLYQPISKTAAVTTIKLDRWILHHESCKSIYF